MIRTTWHITDPAGRDHHAHSAEEFHAIVSALQADFGRDCELEIYATVEASS